MNNSRLALVMLYCAACGGAPFETAISNQHEQDASPIPDVEEASDTAFDSEDAGDNYKQIRPNEASTDAMITPVDAMPLVDAIPILDAMSMIDAIHSTDAMQPSIDSAKDSENSVDSQPPPPQCTNGTRMCVNSEVPALCVDGQWIDQQSCFYTAQGPCQAGECSSN
jgi:hypothetical protein